MDHDVREHQTLGSEWLGCSEQALDVVVASHTLHRAEELGLPPQRY